LIIYFCEISYDRLPVSPQKRCIFHVSVQSSSSNNNKQKEEENMIEKQQKSSPSHNFPCPLVVDTNGMYFRLE